MCFSYIRSKCLCSSLVPFGSNSPDGSISPVTFFFKFRHQIKYLIMYIIYNVRLCCLFFLFYLSLTLFFSYSIFLLLYLSLTLSLSYSISLLLYLFLTLSFSSLSHSNPFSLLLCPSLTLSISYSISLLLYFSLALFFS